MNIEGITGGCTNADLIIELLIGRMYNIMQESIKGVIYLHIYRPEHVKGAGSTI